MVYLKRTSVILFSLLSFLIFCSIDFKSEFPEETGVPNFSRFSDISEKKLRFFAYLKPIVEQENARVLAQRERLLLLDGKRKQGEGFSEQELQWVDQIATEYQVNITDYATADFWELLGQRIDMVPIDLVLVQSANESAWGTSRFAIMGNAMFGQQTFSQEYPGIVPFQRRPGARHTVERFESVRLSVRSYINNLNTHPAYLAFRMLRSIARIRGKTPDGEFLAAGLALYSERRQEYIREIRDMISINKGLMGLD